MVFRRTASRYSALIAILFFAISAIYLWSLYRHLETTFAKVNQFIPTRIYSDTTRIAPPQRRGQVESRLRALGYSIQSSEEAIDFQLHPIDYPGYLLPDGHITLESGLKPVSLKFDGLDPASPIHSIQVNGGEVSDLWLEPELVATLSRGEEKKEIRTNLSFGDVPAPVWQAIIAIEDQNFLQHKGIDPRGIARAFWVNLKTFSLAQGGSTITLQLVKNLMARRTKNIFQKTNELFLALLLEAKYGKEEILERYLNEVYLGQVGSYEVHGVAEGARHFFGKSVNELSLAETALMAGLIRGPGYYSPYRWRERAVERQRLVLRKMVETGFIAEQEAKSALKQVLRFAPPQTGSNKAPYFTDFVKAEIIRELRDRISEQEITTAGFKVYTTLDPVLNQFAQQAVAQGIAKLEAGAKNGVVLEGALAAVDHSNGSIRALVGGKNYAGSTFNRILNMRRQVGSTFKPFVFLAALQKGEDAKGVPYGPGYPVEDAKWKLTYDRGKQIWEPRNYEKEYLGWIPMRTALSHSINTVAAKLGVEIGLDEVIKTARALGVEADLPAVPSLSLGIAELSPVELLKAWAAIANHGIQEELTVIRGITQADGTNYARFVHHPKQVFAAAPVDLLTDMLQNVFLDGTAKSAAKMGFDRPAAGKTGTTSNHRDSWFAGFTPQLTAVVWVGSDQVAMDPKSQLMKLTGATSALPIWVGFMKEALQGEPSTPFPINQSLVSTRIDRMSGKLATSDCPVDQTSVEKYISGHEPQMTACDTMWPASVLHSVSE